MSTSFLQNRNYRLCCFILISALMTGFLVALPSPADAQPTMTEKPQINRQQYNVHRVFREADNDELTPFNEEPPDRCPPNQPRMSFYLDWTNYLMHRVNNDSQIEIILPGTVWTTGPLTWTLTTVAPENDGPPHLYFVENIFGGENGADIELTWEIRHNRCGWNGWHNMANHGNSLIYVFPESICDCGYDFEVRIRGNPVYHQADGHYRLELNQQLTPGL